MVYYSFQVQFYWLFFYLLYAALLSRETFFHLNRAYLLTGLAAGLVFPLIRWDAHPAAAEVVMQPFIVTASAVKTAAEGFSDRWIPMVFLTIYLAGAAVQFIRLIVGLRQIARLAGLGVREQHGNLTVIRLEDEHQPSFSFLRWVFIPAGLSEQEGAEKIIRHEISHCRQLHSLDVLFVSALQIAFWWSPLIYLYRRSLQNVHEYLADRSVLKIASVRQYAGLLVRQTQPLQQISFANHFIHSLIKKRILMMTKKRSSYWSAAKYSLVVPFALALTFAFGKSARPASSKPFSGIAASPIESAPTARPLPTRVLKTPTDTTIVPSGPADEKPEFPGGQEALFKYLGDNIKYPKESRKRRYEGIVYVGFNVGKGGDLSDFLIKKALINVNDTVIVINNVTEGKIARVDVINSDKDIEEEALRVIKKMPRWTPARLNGIPVPASYVIPIRFKLE